MSFYEGSVRSQRLAVVGCTGSVGSSVLDVCRCYPDRFRVEVLASYSGRGKLARLVEEFGASKVVLQVSSDEKMGVPVTFGQEALLALAEDPMVDHVVVASSGVGALMLTRRALENGKVVSLANKESAIILGEWIAPYCASGQLRPLDSEHNAVWQCLRGEDMGSVERIFLTASGGPFLNRALDEFDSITPEMAIAHPVWSMGSKISVDSATMINKGIEMLEAMYLFGVEGSKIVPVIHPGSKVHGMVSFRDGATKMLLSAPDMRLPAMSALCYPDRPELLMDVATLDVESMSLEFCAVDEVRFPGIALVKRAIALGGVYPVVVVAADEVAVEAFMQGRIGFTEIAMVIERVMDRAFGLGGSSLEERLEAYNEALRIAREVVEAF